MKFLYALCQPFWFLPRWYLPAIQWFRGNRGNAAVREGERFLLILIFLGLLATLLDNEACSSVTFADKFKGTDPEAVPFYFSRFAPQKLLQMPRTNNKPLQADDGSMPGEAKILGPELSRRIG
jgi:hypothetical protein